MTKEKLTKKEQLVWQAIICCLLQAGKMPTRVELSALTGRSPQNLQYIVKRLAQKGWILKIPKKRQGILLI